MYLMVPGVVYHQYHIKCTLNQGGEDRDWLSPEFHQEITDWRDLVKQTADRPTHLAVIVRQYPTHLGLCNASIIGEGGLWIYPTKFGTIIVWHHPFPSDITDALVSKTNPGETLINYEFDISNFVINEANLLAELTQVITEAPHSGS